MDKSKFFSSLVSGIIISAIAVALLWGGVALISMGHIPLVIKFCNSLGFLFFFIGLIITILMGVLVWIDATDPYIIKKQEKQRIKENAEEEKKELRSGWLAEPIDSIGFLLAFIYKKPIVWLVLI